MKDLDEHEGPRAGSLNKTHLRWLLIVNHPLADVSDQNIWRQQRRDVRQKARDIRRGKRYTRTT